MRIAKRTDKSGAGSDEADALDALRVSVAELSRAVSALDETVARLDGTVQRLERLEQGLGRRLEEPPAADTPDTHAQLIALTGAVERLRAAVDDGLAGLADRLDAPPSSPPAGRTTAPAPTRPPPSIGSHIARDQR